MLLLFSRLVDYPSKHVLRGLRLVKNPISFVNIMSSCFKVSLIRKKRVIEQLIKWYAWLFLAFVLQLIFILYDSSLGFRGIQWT